MKHKYRALLTCVVAQLAGYAGGEAALPSTNEWWANTVKVWSGDVIIKIQGSTGLLEGGLTTGQQYKFTFDDSIRSQKWTTTTSDGRKLVISRTPECVYVDMLGGGVLDKWGPKYECDSPLLTIRDPRLAGLCPINAWGYESLLVLGDKYRKELQLSREGNGDLVGALSVVTRVPYAKGHGRDGEVFSYTLNRRLYLDTDTLRVTMMRDAFMTVDGAAFEYFSNEATIQYGRCDGQVVPVYWTGTSKTGDSLAKLNVEFEWVSANQQISSTTFMPEGLGLLGGTLIVDRRLDVPIMESAIPRDGVDDLPGGEFQLAALKPRPLLGWRNLALIATGLVIVLLLVLIVRARLHDLSSKC